MFHLIPRGFRSVSKVFSGVSWGFKHFLENISLSSETLKHHGCLLEIIWIWFESHPKKKKSTNAQMFSTDHLQLHRPFYKTNLDSHSHKQLVHSNNATDFCYIPQTNRLQFATWLVLSHLCRGSHLAHLCQFCSFQCPGSWRWTARWSPLYVFGFVRRSSAILAISVMREKCKMHYWISIA